MVERVFLGWDRPFLSRAVDWLLLHRDALPRMVVVVPTSQSGRHLRDALTDRAGALLAPTIMTPGSFLNTPAPDVAADWMEILAWMETLENVPDWTIYQELFPHPPLQGSPWAAALATEMVKLRRSLQENGLTLASAATLLAGSVEAMRWQNLAHLENLLERQLESWGLKCRSRVLADGLNLPQEIARIVLVGITEMPPLVERAWASWPGQVTALIAAPEAEAHTFSPTGRPLSCWTERTLPWPDGPSGAVHLVADSRQQATTALQVIATAQSASNDVALGSADTETGDELARALTRQGWTAFHPAAAQVPSGLCRWFKGWSAWLDDPTLAALANLLAMPETASLVGGRRAEIAERLARLRNDWIVIRPDDLRHRIATTTFRSKSQREAALDVLETSESLESIRNDFLQSPFLPTLERLIDTLGRAGPSTADEGTAILDWFNQADPLIRQVPRSPPFWINLMLAQTPVAAAQPPKDRVIDVQGWLELLFEPGHHLVLCGLNEGMIPARIPAGPWLGQTAAKQLGLTVDSDRAARDAFLFQAMLEARRDHGRVDLICAKSGPGGQSLLPSRLLLAAHPADLPHRVKTLFRGIEPPEAALRWHRDWQWKVRTHDAPIHRIPVTSLATYLACPFRFYLKHSHAMQRPEPDRVEWNERDFGTITHEILEQWGRDPTARHITESATLNDWLSAALDRLITAHFAQHVPLAVRVQSEVLRQRLSWFANVQSQSIAEGWEIIEVESKFEIPFANT
ncbi:MAG: hypothetical protein RLZZ282_558, partial [Verrucomicrobiota bacterium]